MDLTKFLPMTESTYYIMLALLEPLHGYGIMQQVRTYSGGSVDLAPGTLYGALENLKKQKLICLDEEESDKRRKVYRLTEMGSAVLTLEYKRLEALVAVSQTLLEKANAK